MAVLIASGATLGLRPVGGGGLTAPGAYDQIVWLLRQSFGTEHAALFTRPSARLGGVDWFADLDADTRPVRLNEAEPELRDKALAKLCKLVSDIEAKAAALLKSDRQDERVFGDMLTRALEVPDDKAIFQIGAQPLLTFWGYVPDRGTRLENPLQTLIRPFRPQHASAPKLDATPVDVDPASADTEVHEKADLAESDAVSAKQDVVSEGVDSSHRDPKRRWLWWLLALLLLLLILIGAIALLRHWPIPHDDGKTRDDSTQAPATLVIPPSASAGNLEFIKGCWNSHGDLVDSVTHKTISETYCFNADGSGFDLVRYADSGMECRGTILAHLDGDKLVIENDGAKCPDSTSFSAGRTVCLTAAGGEARCDWTKTGENQPHFTNFPFLRDKQP